MRLMLMVKEVGYTPMRFPVVEHSVALNILTKQLEIQRRGLDLLCRVNNGLQESIHCIFFLSVICLLPLYAISMLLVVHC